MSTKPPEDGSGSGDSSGKPTSASEIDRTLAHSRIGGDVLEAFELARDSDPKSDVPLENPLHEDGLFSVIIETNANFPGGADKARDYLIALYSSTQLRAKDDGPGATAGGLFAVDEQVFSPAEQLNMLIERGTWSSAVVTIVDMMKGITARTQRVFNEGDKVSVNNSLLTDKYIFATLSEATIRALAEYKQGDKDNEPMPLVYRITGNHPIEHEVFESGRTVKCDAARATFGATGKGVVWAVADSGIDKHHPHFRKHGNLETVDGLDHHDFTDEDAALVDDLDHGTHVAGIIAGETHKAHEGAPQDAHTLETFSVEKMRKEDGRPATPEDLSECTVTGIAPECKLISLKVVNKDKNAKVEHLIAALSYVRLKNSDDKMRIHGVNISMGHPFNATWYAAGYSPLCKEVDRLVRSGVIVVVAAGNGGYGRVKTHKFTSQRATHLGTIDDPGNAERAITVGSAHRNSPHTFGVSFFSGKGPTADGRDKPDLVAPGERIVSAKAMGQEGATHAEFMEQSGTSMAAPHVSGCAAAFLSIRKEFICQPEKVKNILMETSTDLGRRREFQGAGMIDLMRAIQSV